MSYVDEQHTAILPLFFCSRSEATAFLGLTNSKTLQLSPRSILARLVKKFKSWQGSEVRIVVIDESGSFFGAFPSQGKSIWFEIDAYPSIASMRPFRASSFAQYAITIHNHVRDLTYHTRSELLNCLSKARVAAAAALKAIHLSSSELSELAERQAKSENGLFLSDVDYETAETADSSEPTTDDVPHNDEANRDPIDRLLYDYRVDSTNLTDWAGDFPMPCKKKIVALAEACLELVLPGYYGRCPNTQYFEDHVRRKVSWICEALGEQISRVTEHQFGRIGENDYRARAEEQAMTVIDQLPRIRGILAKDIKAGLDADPSVFSHHEIAASSPGIAAVAIYRIAHEFELMHIPFIPKLLTEFGHSRFGIDIHPGAVIGPGFFIDHGTGVVIGQTAKIGKNVTIYQGVTLGSLSFPRDENNEIVRGQKRHPTLEDNVVVYANASILGGNTLVGRDSVIGANVRLTRSVPPESLVTIQIEPPKIRARKRPREMSLVRGGEGI